MKKLKIFLFIVAIIAVSLLFLAGLLCIISPILRDVVFNSTLKDIPNESDSVPAHVIYGEIHTESQKVNIAWLCKEQNKSMKEIFCIAGDNVYFVYTSAGAWVIASMNLETKAFTDHCQLSDAKETYQVDPYGDYSERNGFCYDKQIILSDFCSVLVYDIISGETSRHDYNTFVFPQKKAYGEALGEQTLKLYINESAYTFTLQEAAENSDGIAALYAMKDKKTWDKTSPLISFFGKNRIQVIDDEIYTIEAVLSYSGLPYAVILKYDTENNVWLYVSACFAGDNITRNCYVIPSI